MAESLRILHFAPEPWFAQRLSSRPGLHHVTADICAPDVCVAADITRLPFDADTFDIIPCSHVLEHIQDDSAAMRALLRVLKPGGWAMLQVPVDRSLQVTFEDPLVTYQLILLPLEQVTSIIGEVMVPVMARGRADPAQVRLAFTRAVQAVALVLFPIMIGIVIVADEAIPILFGDQWRAAAPVARVLAVGGCFQALGETVGWIYQSQGRSDVMFRWGLFATVVTFAGIAAGLPWGVVGVATGYTAAVIILTPLSHHVAGRLIGMRMRELLLGVKPALVATIVMAVTAGLVRTVLLRSGQGDLVVLLGAAIAGIGVYVLALAGLRPVSIDGLGSLSTRPKRSP
jgi:hypothetical protein